MEIKEIKWLFSIKIFLILFCPLVNLNAQFTKSYIDLKHINTSYDSTKSTEITNIKFLCTVLPIEKQKDAQNKENKNSFSESTSKHFHEQGYFEHKNYYKAKKALIDIKSKVIDTLPLNNNLSIRSADIPVIGNNFMSGGFGNPTDNTLAISNEGIIVSATNETLEYHYSGGKRKKIFSWYEFMESAEFVIPDILSTYFFDPRVIYDTKEDRFILILCNKEADDSGSKLLAFFSKSNNPSEGWYGYIFSGDPLHLDYWTDYPNIAISNNELYISTNQCKDNSCITSVILVLNKFSGYNGIPDFTSQTAKLWSNIAGNPFSIVPVPYGQEGNYGPGIFLVRICKEITYPFCIPRRIRGLRFTTTFALFLRFKFCQETQAIIPP